MAKSIFITGISGTGKSTLTKELIRRGKTAFDIEDIPGLFSMVDQKTDETLREWDNADLELVKRCKWLCNREKLAKLMTQQNNQGIVYYLGSLSNTDEILPLFDKVIVLQAHPEVLRERLTHRTENDFGQTTEVQEWLFSNQEERDEEWRKKGVTFIDANGSVQDTADAVIAASNF